MNAIPHTVTVENRVEELTRIYDALEEFAKRSQLSETVYRTLLLVVEELFTNVVNHGYAADIVDSIVLTMACDGEDVTLTIRDRGKPFDSAGAVQRPAGDQSLDDMRIGGLGLFLVHEFARSVASRRDGDINVTEVRLPLAGEA